MFINERFRHPAVRKLVSNHVVSYESWITRGQHFCISLEKPDRKKCCTPGGRNSFCGGPRRPRFGCDTEAGPPDESSWLAACLARGEHAAWLAGFRGVGSGCGRRRLCGPRHRGRRGGRGRLRRSRRHVGRRRLRNCRSAGARRSRGVTPGDLLGYVALVGRIPCGNLVATTVNDAVALNLDAVATTTAWRRC